MKQCSKCGEVKNEDYFSACTRSLDGFSAYCKACAKNYAANYYKKNAERINNASKTWYTNNKSRAAARGKKWRASNLEKVKKGRRKAVLHKKYGISENDYSALLKWSRGGCAICGKKTRKNLSVDHDHKTGRVRGLLCQHCNIGLGYFNDDRRLLKIAIAYLEYFD